MRLIGQREIALPESGRDIAEIDYLRTAKRAYTEGLLRTVPMYRAIQSEALIPDTILQALRRREASLLAESAG